MMTPLLAILLCTLSQLDGDRLVCQFDFEEARLRPLEMPLAFEQITHRVPGSDFPSFGEMRLTEDRPSNGQFAFRFDLKGRSMAARTRSGAIPVTPMVDHLVSIDVRTSDLERAGVRIIGWLEDRDGNAIIDTRVGSRVVRCASDAADRWSTIELNVPGSSEDACELVLELQLVQPDLQVGQYNTVHQSRPLLEDVSGQVDFDNIRIEQWPRLRLADASRIGLHIEEKPVIHLRIDDPAATETTWQLEVRDSHGNVVHKVVNHVPPDGVDETIVLGLERYDWYQVHVRVDEAGRSLVSDTLSLTMLPKIVDHHTTSRVKLDLTGPESTNDFTAMAVDLLGHLGAGEAIIPIWHPDQSFQESWPETRDHVDELKRIGIDSVLALNWIPPEHHATGPFDLEDAAALLASEPEVLDSTLNAAIIAWGDDAARWQIGRLDDSPAERTVARRTVMDRLDGLVVDLDVVHPVTRPLQENTDGSAWERMRSSAQALIEAWFRNDEQVVVRAPWKQGTNGMEPTASYAPLYTLIHAMAHRDNSSKIPTPPTVEARLLQGPDHAPVIIAWRTAGMNGDAIDGVLPLPEATAKIRACDALGNRVAVLHSRDESRISIGELPVVIEGFTTEVVCMMASLAVVPERLNASVRVHDHQLELRNTMHESMNGHLILRPIDGVSIRPSIIGLSLSPGETMTRDIEIVVTTPLPDGHIPLELEARLDSGRRLPMTTWLETGMSQLDVVWSRRTENDNDDLVIDLHISNHGDTTRHLDASLSHPELTSLRPTELRVDPAATLMQTFRIPEGQRQLQNGDLIMRLTDRVSQERLRNVLPMTPRPQTAAVDDLASR